MKNKWVVAICLILAVGLIWKSKGSKSSTSAHESIMENIPAKKVNINKNKGFGPLKNQDGEKNSTKPEAIAGNQNSIVDDREYRSIENLSGMMLNYSQNAFSAQALVGQLKNLGLNPVLADWSNEETGKMYIVRTTDTLPGTRHFHAQFFENEDGQPFLQHMSFEIKPTTSAMGDAIKLVEANFAGQVGERVINTQDYVKWETGNGYVIGLKKLKLEDLEEDPFNAYSPEDVGTYQVAIEQDIHGQDDHQH